MTTPRTPYDAGIAQLASEKREHELGAALQETLSGLRNMREGYRQAQTDYAPLLAAAEGALLWMDNNLIATDVSGLEDRKALRAVIKQAKEGAA